MACTWVECSNHENSMRGTHLDKVVTGASDGGDLGERAFRVGVDSSHKGQRERKRLEKDLA